MVKINIENDIGAVLNLLGINQKFIESGKNLLYLHRLSLEGNLKVMIVNAISSY